jgi:hypothetical protein
MSPARVNCAGVSPTDFSLIENAMNDVLNPGLGRLVIALVVGCCGLFAGCNSTTNAPVNASKAREHLRTALDSWKAGEPATALRNRAPPIYVIDTEWQSGAMLTEYQIVGDGEEKDAVLFCKVKLTVRDTNGKDQLREVTFIVSTSPNVTVSRKIF